MTRPAIGFKPVLIPLTDRYHAKRACWNGEPPRPPRKGELYLSGAVPRAYRAPADLTSSYYIAKEIDS